MNLNYPLDATNICRTCLAESSFMKSVFSYEHVLEQKIMLCDMLMSCASILVLHEDGLPENICQSCCRQINTAYLFRKLCEKSDAALRECISNFNDIQGNIFEIQVDSTNFESTVVSKYVSEHEETRYDSRIPTMPAITKKNCLTGTYEKTIHNEGDFTKISKPNESINPHQSKSEIQGHGSFRCEQCNKEFEAENLLARHNMLVHKTGSSKLRSIRNQSGAVRKRNLSHTCQVCNKSFRGRSNLERHKLIHTGEKPYLCNVCGKSFAQMAYLKIHSFTHTGEKPYKCQTCDRSFAAPGTLMTHVRTHTGERPHICKICGKDFPQSGYLSAHIRTHTGEKPIECKVCHQRFNQSGRLIVHMRIHSGEKPYQCPTCDRSFAVKGTLKKHMRTHTGERPYKCKMCGQAFAQSGTLATHMKIHTSKAVNEKPIAWT